MKQEILNTLKPYIVNVTIYCGEYEKSSQCIVTAPSRNLAVDYALYLESHTPQKLDWSEPNRVYDLNGEFAYSGSADQLELSDYEIIKRYISDNKYDHSELLASGNYADVNPDAVMEIETFQLPVVIENAIPFFEVPKLHLQH